MKHVVPLTIEEGVNLHINISDDLLNGRLGETRLLFFRFSPLPFLLRHTDTSSRVRVLNCSVSTRYSKDTQSTCSTFSSVQLARTLVVLSV